MANDVNDGETTEASTGGLDRRSMIKAGAVAGAAAWVVPQVVSMSSAAAGSGCAAGFSESFAGLFSGGASPGYQPYGPGPANPSPPAALPLSYNGWTTSAGTVTVDAVTHGSYGTGGFNNLPSVIIDLAGTPGPGGITRSGVAIPCAGTYTLAFQSLVLSAGPVVATVTGAGITSAPLVIPTSALQNNALVFTSAGPTSVTITLSTTDSSSGNVFVANISIA